MPNWRVVSLDNAHWIWGFNQNVSCVDIEEVRICLKHSCNELLPSVVCCNIRWSKIHINPSQLRSSPDGFCCNVWKPACSLISCRVVYHVENRFLFDVKYIEKKTICLNSSSSRRANLKRRGSWAYVWHGLQFCNILSSFVFVFRSIFDISARFRRLYNLSECEFPNRSCSHSSFSQLEKNCCKGFQCISGYPWNILMMADSPVNF